MNTGVSCCTAQIGCPGMQCICYAVQYTACCETWGFSHSRVRFPWPSSTGGFGGGIQGGATRWENLISAMGMDYMLGSVALGHFHSPHPPVSPCMGAHQCSAKLMSLPYSHRQLPTCAVHTAPCCCARASTCSDYGPVPYMQGPDCFQQLYPSAVVC